MISRNYSSVHAEEDEPLVERRRSSFTKLWKILLVALVVGQLAVIGLLLNERGVRSPSTIGAKLGDSEVPSTDNKVDSDVLTQSTLLAPHKLSLDLITPRQDQANRGTCWDFATIGMLEHSYRANGYKNGWLAHDEYVKFSEQAFGIAVVAQCRARPNTCLIPDDEVWLNSTEGGEIPLLYYLPELNTQVLPHSVCPYYKDENGQHICPGMDDAMKANPVKFTVKHMTTLYEAQSIKNHLRTYGRALGFSTSMTTTTYWYPCTGKTKDRPECRKKPCTPCPMEKFPANLCCVRMSAESYNLEGEFYSHGKTDFKNGGHAMLLVGYNDNYMTEMGDVGGFILKNNWNGVGHSQAYYMQDISRWDESRICPNSINPRNWYDCPDMEKCLAQETELYSSISFMPLKLKCVHPKLCKIDKDILYYVNNATHAGDDMVEMCVFEYHTVKGTHKAFCLGPYPLDDYVAIFRPIQMLKDDPDRCGFFFFPYGLMQRWWSTYRDGFITDFDVEWAPESYAANRDKFPQFDYALLERSRKKQAEYVFTGPFPQDMTKNKFKPGKNPNSYVPASHNDASAIPAGEDTPTHDVLPPQQPPSFSAVNLDAVQAAFAQPVHEAAEAFPRMAANYQLYQYASPVWPSLGSSEYLNTLAEVKREAAEYEAKLSPRELEILREVRSGKGTRTAIRRAIEQRRPQ